MTKKNYRRGGKLSKPWNKGKNSVNWSQNGLTNGRLGSLCETELSPPDERLLTDRKRN